MKRTDEHPNLMCLAASAVAVCFTVIAGLSRAPAEVVVAMSIAIVGMVLAMASWSGNWHDK